MAKYPAIRLIARSRACRCIGNARILRTGQFLINGRLAGILNDLAGRQESQTSIDLPSGRLHKRSDVGDELGCRLTVWNGHRDATDHVPARAKYRCRYTYATVVNFSSRDVKASPADSTKIELYRFPVGAQSTGSDFIRVLVEERSRCSRGKVGENDFR